MGKASVTFCFINCIALLDTSHNYILRDEEKTDTQCAHIDKVNPKIHENTKGWHECDKIDSGW
jgi:hypothetical protein